MKIKQRMMTAHSRVYRRQYDPLGQPLRLPAETHLEGDTLVMVIDGVRFIGIRDKARGFYWWPETGEG